MRKEFVIAVCMLILVILPGCTFLDRIRVPQTLDPQTGLPMKPDCDQAELISETIPAGTEFEAGVTFDKTWIIKNISPCEWSDQFSLVYYDGVGMDGITHISFAENLPAGTVIPPGGTATLTLNLRAPYAPGNQVGIWKLRDPSGMLFVPFNAAPEGLTVSINIIGSIYNFLDNLCEAIWTIDGQPFECDTVSPDRNGSILADPFPMAEENVLRNEPAIALEFPANEHSVISGQFPAIEVHPGDHLHFMTTCGQDLPACDLTFEVGYLVDSTQGILGSWHELSDGKMQVVDIDLSSLSGQMVRFVLTTRTNTASLDNQGYWFLPVILPY